MSWTEIALLTYLAGMMVTILRWVDLIRENPDDDPIVDQLHYDAKLRFLVVLLMAVLSSVWPLIAADAAIRRARTKHP